MSGLIWLTVSYACTLNCCPPCLRNRTNCVVIIADIVYRVYFWIENECDLILTAFPYSRDNRVMTAGGRILVISS